MMINKKIIVITGILLTILIAGSACGVTEKESQTEEDTFAMQIVTTISDEEYEFYKECVQKDYKGKDEDEDKKKNGNICKRTLCPIYTGRKI